jgi:hypothetical protein
MKILNTLTFNLFSVRNILFTLFFILFPFFFVLVLISSCNTTEPPSEKAVMSLTKLDVSCTEAWIRLDTKSLSLPANVELYKNDSLNQTINLTTADSTLYVDSLLPNQTYNFHTTIQTYNNSGKVNSNDLNVNTLDTTSNNFTFQTWTFGGQAGSCILSDCAIISANDIWCVGEINIADTSQNGYTLYNAVHWNGTDWQLKRIPYVDKSNGQTYYNGLNAIFAFNENDIWFGTGIHWNGQEYNYVSAAELFGWDANKMWGPDSNDLYAVGNGGHIARFQNGVWSRLESGTILNIYDIWGDYDSSKSEYEINMVAAQHFEGPGRKIFSLKNNSVEELSTPNIADGSIGGIWFKSGRKYYVVGNGIYTKKNIFDESNWNASLDSLTPDYCYAIRGTGLNNIFICGSFGESLHFNGVRWKSFRDTPGFYGTEFYSVAVKEGIVVIVGQSYNSAFVTVGRTQ